MKTKIYILIFVFAISRNMIAQNKTTDHKATVFVFLSETCPICQSYTLPLKELYKKYSNQGVRFVGVFPNYYVTQKDIEEFRKTYKIPFDLQLDKDTVLIKKFKAYITPEVFVEDASGKLIYSGRIDDSFYAIGKRRKVVTTHELADALAELGSGKPVSIPKTQAIGCIINTSNK